MPRFSLIIRRPFLWALVALVPLSARPVVACTCEPSCPLNLHMTTSGQCSLRVARTSYKPAERACCSSQATCLCQTNPPVPDGKCCCNLDPNPSATAAQPVKFASSIQWEALDAAAHDVTGATTFSEGASRKAYGDTGPPVLDRVVCLHRLLI